MSVVTPRRSTKLPHVHTPKMSERKKGLFQCMSITPPPPSNDSLTKHRKLPVVDSESDSEDCDLGIISTLDSSSGEENDNGISKTPERSLWHETRSQTRKLLREDHNLKCFIKSPFMLKKYQSKYSCMDSKCTGSVSTPATPHLQYHPGTPSSSHSCASMHTTSSTSSRARKSLASLIADTESCSSSLKDLNFDTDSGTDSKENTPTKLRRSTRKLKMTPKFKSFKGILVEQKKNLSPMKTAGISPLKNPVVCLTKMDMTTLISPSQFLKTPQTTDSVDSPPKLSHNRRGVVEIAESPDSNCDSEKVCKRLRNDSLSDEAPSSKYPRFENAPKARLSLFNSDRLKEMLSAKSFYGKSNPELNQNVTTKISHAIEASTINNRKSFSHSHSRRRKKTPGQINMGVKHKIRKPKYSKNKIAVKYCTGKNVNTSQLNKTASTLNTNDSSMLSVNSSQDLDKADPFDKEKQTIEALLSQWEEEEIPASEISYNKPELPCFNKTVMEATSQIFQPVTVVPVTAVDITTETESVLIELGSKDMMRTPDMPTVTTLPQAVTTLPQVVTTLQQPVTNISENANTLPETLSMAQDVVMAEPDSHSMNHGLAPKNGQFLPVDGGYMVVGENGLTVQEDLPDLDEIERELRMLDEQILKIAESNNINAEAVLASTETGLTVSTDKNESSSVKVSKEEGSSKLFPIFSNPNPGTSLSATKAPKSNKRMIAKHGDDQYIIDAGQKKFGATQCTECGTIYQIGDPQDEHDHLVHHNATDVLRFNGWKDECIIEKNENWRIIRVRYGDPNWRRVDTLLKRVIHPQLGYEGPLTTNNQHALTAYLYIEKKQIVGCLIAEPKIKGYKLIPGEPDCCSVEDYPVKCGISRIWTHINFRRRGVARKLVNCARACFLYGEALRITDLAFSAPTATGKAFATQYCGTQHFYVYLD